MNSYDGTDTTSATDTPDPDRGAGTEMTNAFLAFHRANPNVYLALRDLAREWRSQGKKKCGIDLLYNVARWRMSLAIQGDGTFELNDHYRAFYARALMFFEDDLAGLFDVRRAPEADRWVESLHDALKGRAA